MRLWFATSNGTNTVSTRFAQTRLRTARPPTAFSETERSMTVPSPGRAFELQGDLRPATCDLRPATCDLRPATCDLRPATCDLRPATCDLRPATCDQCLPIEPQRVNVCGITKDWVAMDNYQFSLPSEPEAAHAARLALGEVLHNEASASVNTAVLLASELVTNAVRHGREEIDVSIRVEPGRFLHVEIRDGESTLPKMAAQDPSSERGKGLLIVDVLSSRWGAERDGAGKVVWFELDLNGLST